MPLDREVPLDRHAEIVRSIYKENEHDQRLLSIITGRQDADGHRYSGERCVWCGVNYLDHMLYAGGEGVGCHINYKDDESCPEPCAGPPEGEWGEDDSWWPLAKVDALLDEHRRSVREAREKRIRLEVEAEFAEGFLEKDEK